MGYWMRRLKQQETTSCFHYVWESTISENTVGVTIHSPPKPCCMLGKTGWVWAGEVPNTAPNKFLDSLKYKTWIHFLAHWNTTLFIFLGDLNAKAKNVCQVLEWCLSLTPGHYSLWGQRSSARCPAQPGQRSGPLPRCPAGTGLVQHQPLTALGHLALQRARETYTGVNIHTFTHRRKDMDTNTLKKEAHVVW